MLDTLEPGIHAAHFFLNTFVSNSANINMPIDLSIDLRYRSH
jgi:hypothetical protein